MNTIKRIGTIYSRYSFNRFMDSFNEIIENLENYDAKATFPITGITLERNQDFIKSFKTKRIEWALHGYLHIDYAKLNKEVIAQHIANGKEVFKNVGIKLYGFRAPYLSINKEGLGELYKAGFIYDSSKTFFAGGIQLNRSTELILDYYRPMKTWKIEKIENIVEIPVSLPDDEILVDRLGYRSDKVGDVWIKMCDKIINIGGIPVLQLHPERGKICSDALKNILQWAAKKDVSVLQLKDIAKGKKDNVMAITGDVDIMKISDFIYVGGGRKI